MKEWIINKKCWPNSNKQTKNQKKIITTRIIIIIIILLFYTGTQSLSSLLYFKIYMHRLPFCYWWYWWWWCKMVFFNAKTLDCACNCGMTLLCSSSCRSWCYEAKMCEVAARWKYTFRNCFLLLLVKLCTYLNHTQL